MFMNKKETIIIAIAVGFLSTYFFIKYTIGFMAENSLFYLFIPPVFFLFVSSLVFLVNKKSTKRKENLKNSFTFFWISYLTHLVISALALFVFLYVVGM